MQLLVKCYDIKTVWVPTFLFTCVDKRGDLTNKKESRIGMQKVLLIFVPIHYILNNNIVCFCFKVVLFGNADNNGSQIFPYQTTKLTLICPAILGIF